MEKHENGFSTIVLIVSITLLVGLIIVGFVVAPHHTPIAKTVHASDAIYPELTGEAPEN